MFCQCHDDDLSCYIEMDHRIVEQISTAFDSKHESQHIELIDTRVAGEN